MSRYMGSLIAGPPPPYVPKTKAGRPRNRPNKYADLKPSEQRNTSGQRRQRRQESGR